MILLALVGCAPQWDVLGEGLDAALLQVRQDDDGDVWAIGGDAGDGPAIWIYDGAAWDTLSTGDSGALWWSWADDDAVWLTGDGGRVLRYDRASGEFGSTVVNEVFRFFGIWGVPGGPIWVVGEDLTGVEGAQIWTTTDGATWTEETVPVDMGVLFKIWGTAADDVWAVGQSGIILHRDATAWSSVESPVSDALISVAGNGKDDVVAVGGEGNGTVIEFDGTSWSDASPSPSGRISGTWVPDGCEAIAAGDLGAIFFRTDGEWVAEKKVVTDQDYHGAFVDEDCGAWVAGGRLTSPSLDEGVLAYKGPAKIPPLE